MLRFPVRVLPSYKVILRIINNARQENFRYKRVHRQWDREIIRTVRSYPHDSIREIARRTGFSVGKVHKGLRQARHHPYHIYHHQALSDQDRMRRQEFCIWGDELIKLNRHFSNRYSFQMMMTFMSDGSLNRCNCHSWSNINYHKGSPL